MNNELEGTGYIELAYMKWYVQKHIPIGNRFMFIEHDTRDRDEKVSCLMIAYYDAYALGLDDETGLTEAFLYRDLYQCLNGGKAF